MRRNHVVSTLIRRHFTSCARRDSTRILNSFQTLVMSLRRRTFAFEPLLLAGPLRTYSQSNSVN